MATSFPDPGQPVFRFAPSPNGALHLGHALSALTNERLCACHGGRLLLRIENIDPVRCRLEFERAIIDDLAWLGIAFEPDVRRQSAHMGDYAEALATLQARGLVYPCFCSRQQIAAAVAKGEARTGLLWPRDPDGAAIYPGLCRALSTQEAQARAAAGEPHTLRLAMDQAFVQLGLKPGERLAYALFDESGVTEQVAIDPARWGDVVLARRDVATSYHLSVVVDDALQGVSHVVRGGDLEAATEVHVVLQRLLGLPTPQYHFHPLLFDQTGQKLAKRRASQSLAEIRAGGVSPVALRARLGFG